MGAAYLASRGGRLQPPMAIEVAIVAALNAFRSPSGSKTDLREH